MLARAHTQTGTHMPEKKRGGVIDFESKRFKQTKEAPMIRLQTSFNLIQSLSLYQYFYLFSSLFLAASHSITHDTRFKSSCK